MQSKEIQELTASEPLTIEQEYEMQHSWLIDDDSKFVVGGKREGEGRGGEKERGGGEMQNGRGKSHAIFIMRRAYVYRTQEIRRI